MPIFLYLMIGFLYFIQIVTLQERIQSELTKMGLDLSKAAYFYQDFPDLNEAVSFDETIFGNELGINEITDQMISGNFLKLCAKPYLDRDFINSSCIQKGFDGMDFLSSSVMNEEDCIDLVLQYQISIPVRIFSLGELKLLQRVKLRSWTGHQLTAVYQVGESKDEAIVYITDTGTVYHKNKECSHIKLSVTAVLGIPNHLRNDSGSRYTECERCCTGDEGEGTTYYITSYGTKYHTDRSCSGIKRSIKEIALSDVGTRAPCSRCGR